jgi:predicted double-glycine peptidase
VEVPFVRQPEEGCGAAAISMVLQYWSGHGIEVAAGRADTDSIQKQLYSPTARGIYASDVQKYLRDSGFRVFVLEGQWKDFQEHLAKGRPLIVGVQPTANRATLHYVVVTGVDWTDEAVFVHDPARGKLLRVERAQFEKEWQPTHHWMLLAVPAKAA